MGMWYRFVVIKYVKLEYTMNKLREYTKKILNRTLQKGELRDT